MLNLYAASIHKTVLQQIPDFPVEKTAAIVAAGPSFEKNQRKISANRRKYFVIATDTAVRTLSALDMIPDAVVSIDGQNISVNHFLDIPGNSTLFVFDLCANPSAVRTLLDAGKSVLFVRTGHPLCSYASENSGTTEKNAFFTLTTGSGTVTICAADFARLAGFHTMEIFGADFAYPEEKTYMKGTYLDYLYYATASRLIPAETRYDALLFRTPLHKNEEGSKTTEILAAYRQSLQEWAATACTRFCKKNSVYYAELNRTEIRPRSKSPQNMKTGRRPFSFSHFVTVLLKNIRRQHSATEALYGPLEAAMLPYIAYLQYKDSKSGQTSSFSDYLNLAYSNIVGYTYLS
jgi:hypothetical protein